MLYVTVVVFAVLRVISAVFLKDTQLRQHRFLSRGSMWSRFLAGRSMNRNLELFEV